MLPKLEVEPPFVFNLLKHHIRYAKDLLLHYHKEDEQELLEILNKGGNLWSDYYFGPLTPKLICTEIGTTLKGRNLYHEDAYTRWIVHSKGRYQELQLSDGSDWTLLLGEGSNGYVHIHPSRYSSHTHRIRFLALKTALLYLVFYPSIENADPQLINEIRTKYLQASPVKPNGNLSHLEKVIGLIRACI